MDKLLQMVRKRIVNLIDIKASFPSESSATNESDPISATWHDFQTRHIVGSNQGSAAKWNNFFRQRMPSQYGKKGVNTFIVNAASTISKNFPPGVPQVTKLNSKLFKRIL